MRSFPTRLNRGWLGVLGLLLLLAGLAGLLVATGALARLGSAAGADLTRPAPQDTIAGAAASSWFETPLAAIAVGTGALLLTLAGLLWLIRQVPRRGLAKPFRLHDDARHGLTRCDPGVLTDAVERELTDHADIVRASAQLRGSARAPELVVRVTADERADVSSVVRTVQQQTVSGLQTALDTTLTRLGVQVEIDRRRTGSGQITL